MYTSRRIPRDRALHMFGKFLKRDDCSKLTPQDVRSLVSEFLAGWPSFRKDFAEPGDMTVHWIKGERKWTATITPAFDIRCIVTIGDSPGQVTEARLIAMRGGSVLAEWRGET